MKPRYFASLLVLSTVSLALWTRPAMDPSPGCQTLASSSNEAASNARFSGEDLCEAHLDGTSPTAEPADTSHPIEFYSTLKLTSPATNERWVRLANTASKKDGWTFLIFENSMQKHANTITQNKQRVDAGNNFYFTNLLKQIRLLNREFFGDGVEAEGQIIPYSNWKMIGLAYRVPLSKEYKDRLNRIFREANQKWILDNRRLHIFPETEPLGFWYRGGAGRDAFEASHNCRAARIVRGDNVIQWPGTKGVLGLDHLYIEALEKYRSQVEKGWADSGLLDRVGADGKQIPNLSLVELFRKESAPQRLKSLIDKKFHLDTDLRNVMELQTYLEIVDFFSAPIFSTERKFVNLNDAEFGGISMDYAGMGAANLYQTARHLVGVTTTGQALQAALDAERAVTVSFQRMMQTDQQMIRRFLKERLNIDTVDIRCSGDDCVVIFPKEVSTAIRSQLIQYLSSVHPASRRFSFIAAHVDSPLDRSVLSASGEQIEKYLRTGLSGRISSEKLARLTFAIDMSGKKAGQGTAALYIGHSQAKLTANDRRIIRSKFRQAVTQMNQISLNLMKHAADYKAEIEN